MIALGIDPSFKGFGWCVHDNMRLGKDRVVDRGVFTTVSNEIFVSRYVFYRSAVIKLISKFPQISVIGVESPIYGEQWSEGAYALFVYVNEAIYLSRKDVVYFDPKTLKMLAKMDPSIRKGSMDKMDMVEAARAETDIKKWNHNEADAYLVSRSAARFWELETKVILEEDLTPSEQHSFMRVRTITKGRRAGQTLRSGLIFRENDRFFRFSQLPMKPEEEEYRQWLLQSDLGTVKTEIKLNPKKRISQ